MNTIHRYPVQALATSLLITIPFTLNLDPGADGPDCPRLRRPLAVPHLRPVRADYLDHQSTLPITFNGLGLREGIYTFLFVPIARPQRRPVSMSLAFYFLRFSAGLLGGLMIAFKSLVQFVRPPEPEKL